MWKHHCSCCAHSRFSFWSALHFDQVSSFPHHCWRSVCQKVPRRHMDNNETVRGHKMSALECCHQFVCAASWREALPLQGKMAHDTWLELISWHFLMSCQWRSRISLPLSLLPVSSITRFVRLSFPPTSF